MDTSNGSIKGMPHYKTAPHPRPNLPPRGPMPPIWSDTEHTNKDLINTSSFGTMLEPVESMAKYIIDALKANQFYIKTSKIDVLVLENSGQLLAISLDSQFNSTTFAPYIESSELINGRMQDIPYISSTTFPHYFNSKDGLNAYYWMRLFTTPGQQRPLCFWLMDGGRVDLVPESVMITQVQNQPMPVAFAGIYK